MTGIDSKNQLVIVLLWLLWFLWHGCRVFVMNIFGERSKTVERGSGIESRRDLDVATQACIIDRGRSASVGILVPEAVGDIIYCRNGLSQDIKQVSTNVARELIVRHRRFAHVGHVAVDAIQGLHARDDIITVFLFASMAIRAIGFDATFVVNNRAMRFVTL